MKYSRGRLEASHLYVSCVYRKDEELSDSTPKQKHTNLATSRTQSRSDRQLLHRPRTNAPAIQISGITINHVVLTNVNEMSTEAKFSITIHINETATLFALTRCNKYMAVDTNRFCREGKLLTCLGIGGYGVMLWNGFWDLNYRSVQK